MLVSGKCHHEVGAHTVKARFFRAKTGPVIKPSRKYFICVVLPQRGKKGTGAVLTQDRDTAICFEAEKRCSYKLKVAFNFNLGEENLNECLLRSTDFS